MTIEFYKNVSPKEQVTKNLTGAKSVGSVTLKANTSLINPVLVLHDNISNYVDYNYLYIPAFKRYYYIDNITSVIGGLTEISAHVDVLNTYKDVIHGNEAIIEKSESDYQLYLNDGSFPVYADEKIVTKVFPAGFTGFNYYLAVAGA